MREVIRGHPVLRCTQMHLASHRLSSALMASHSLGLSLPLSTHQWQSRTSSRYSCQMHSDALRCTQMHLLDVLLHRVERGRVPWARSTHERQLLE